MVMSDLYQTHTIHLRKKNEVNHYKLELLPGTWYGTTGEQGKLNEERTGSYLLYHRLAASVCYEIVQAGSMIIS